MARRTKDESFLIKLYETAQNEGDLNIEINFQKLGQELTLKDKIIKNIVRDLAQANFILKTDDNTVKLTQNGITLAQKFQEGWAS